MRSLENTYVRPDGQRRAAYVEEVLEGIDGSGRPVAF